MTTPEPALVASGLPVVTGTAKVGRTLKASAGSWNAGGVTVTYRWLRNGAPISGATSKTYKVKKKDARDRLSVTVTARKTGRTTGTATSRATARVKKATSTVSRSLSARSVRSGHKVTVKIKVRAKGIVPQGKVDVYYGAKRVRSGLRLAHGKRATTIRVTGKGKHRVRIVYRGNSGTAGSKATIKVTVR